MKVFTPLRMKLAIVACSVLLGGSLANAVETVKLGIGLSMTGPLAFLSQQYLQGMKAAVEVVNKAGGVGGGRMLELVVRDHKGVPSEAVAVTKRLIEEDKATIVDIDLPSTVAIAAEAVTKESKVPQIAGFTFAPAAVQQGNTFFFRACTTSDLIGDALAQSIVADKNNKTIAMLAPNDDYGRSAIKSLSEAIARAGGPKVVYADYYERTQSDFSAVLLKMKSLNPDSLFIDVRWPASLTVLKQMVEVGLKKPLFSSVNFYNAKLAELGAGFYGSGFGRVRQGVRGNVQTDTRRLRLARLDHNHGGGPGLEGCRSRLRFRGVAQGAQQRQLQKSSGPGEVRRQGRCQRRCTCSAVQGRRLPTRSLIEGYQSCWSLLSNRWSTVCWWALSMR